MSLVELVTIAYGSPLYNNATLVLFARDGGAEGEILEEAKGSFSTDRWSFEVSDEVAQRANRLRFNFSEIEFVIVDVTDPLPSESIFYVSDFQPWQWTRLGPIPDRGQASIKDFDIPRINSSGQPDTYDVIIIGSGMAGGVLAERLADSNIRTLLLEAGGSPLETHIANLPRRNKLGFQKHIWERWFDFRVKNCDSGSHDNQYTDGYQGFNLGGRSVFWGGFIPRMTSAELNFWPRDLKWDLEDRYYQLAEDVMGYSTAPTTEYSRGVFRLLRDKFREYSHFDAPVAMHKNPAGASTISTGIFSTADLLLESHRSREYDSPRNLTIRTHQLAIEVKPGEPCAVTTRDILTGGQNEFIGKFIVISCGCVESARLAKRSNLGNELVGTGITDHPIAWTHFRIPAYRTEPEQEVTRYYDRYGSAKIVSQHKQPRFGIYNMLTELGADFNQGRIIDQDILERAATKNDMLCEVVFLTNSELVLDNRIEFDADNDFRPRAIIRNPGLSPDLRKELGLLRDSLLDCLEGEIINEGWGDGSLGFVAHEVGSLRMEVRDSNNMTGSKQSQSKLDGVVDINGRFLDEEYIYACDLSIFPTSPAANPSLTAVALAIRLADHLVNKLQ